MHNMYIQLHVHVYNIIRTFNIHACITYERGGAGRRPLTSHACTAKLAENMAARRALHFVFKVADRTATATFYRETLGMKVSGRNVCNHVIP